VQAEAAPSPTPPPCSWLSAEAGRANAGPRRADLSHRDPVGANISQKSAAPSWVGSLLETHTCGSAARAGHPPHAINMQNSISAAKHRTHRGFAKLTQANAASRAPGAAPADTKIPATSVYIQPTCLLPKRHDRRLVTPASLFATHSCAGAVRSYRAISLDFSQFDAVTLVRLSPRVTYKGKPSSDTQPVAHSPLTCRTSLCCVGAGALIDRLRGRSGLCGPAQAGAAVRTGARNPLPTGRPASWIEWWLRLRDPLLNRLIEQAVEAIQASQRQRRSCARRGQTVQQDRRGPVPSVSGTASVRDNKTSAGSPPRSSTAPPYTLPRELRFELGARPVRRHAAKRRGGPCEASSPPGRFRDSLVTG